MDKEVFPHKFTKNFLGLFHPQKILHENGFDQIDERRFDKKLLKLFLLKLKDIIAKILEDIAFKMVG